MVNDDTRLINSISFMTAAVLTIGVIFCLSFTKNELNMALITSNYNLPLSDFVAEKSEKYQYIFGTLAFPVFYIAARLFLGKKSFNSRKYEKALDISGFMAIVLLTAVVVIKVPLFLLWFIYNSKKSGAAAVFSIISTVILSGSLFALLMLFERSKKRAAKSGAENPVKTGIGNTAIYAAAAANMAFIVYLFITKTYYYNNLVTGWHFDAYFYPVYKVFCGQTPLVDFNNLYGFYPYFLVPILKLTGGITMLRFSIAMAMIACFIVLAVTLLLFKIIANKFLALLGTLAFTFAAAVLPMLYVQEYYLQYFPHRLLFPVIIVVLCAAITRLKTGKARKWMTGAGYMAAVLSLLWNLDTGVVVLLAFTGFRLYCLLLNYDLKDKKLYRGIAGTGLCAALSAAAALLILIIITYARTGILLRVTDILYAQTSFYGLGFYMLKMPLWSPWLLLVVLYAATLAKALRRIKFLKPSAAGHDIEKNGLLFLLPVIGMGIFSYYQGRSHFLVFLAVIWPGVLLLVLLLDDYWQKIQDRPAGKQKSAAMDSLRFICLFFLLACFAGNYILHAVLPYELPEAKDKTHTVASSELTPVLDAVKTVRKGNEPIDLITYYSAEVYCSLGDTRIANVPATIDWFTKADYQKVFDYLSKTKNKVIIDKGSMDNLKKYEPEKLNAVLERFTLILQTDTCWAYTEKS